MISELRREYADQKAELCEHASMISEIRHEYAEQIADLCEHATELQHTNIRSLQFFGANVLTLFVEKFEKEARRKKWPDSDQIETTHSTTRLVRTASTINENQFLEITNLPRKTLQILKRYPTVSISREILDF